MILSNTPAGSSTKQFVHFAQEIKSEKFRKFDFGFMKNMMVYGSFGPPEYDLRKISVPITMFYGVSDILSSEEVCCSYTFNNIFYLSIKFLGYQPIVQRTSQRHL